MRVAKELICVELAESSSEESEEESPPSFPSVSRARSFRLLFSDSGQAGREEVRDLM